MSDVSGSQKTLLMAKSSSSKNQPVAELVSLYKDTTVNLKNNGNHHRGVNGDTIDSIISPKKSVRKSKRILTKSKDKEDMELSKEYEEIINKIEKSISKKEEIISENEGNGEGLYEKTAPTKSYIEEDLLEIITQVITVGPLREEEDKSNSVDVSNEINMCKRFKPNMMPKVVIKVVPEIENLKKRKLQLNNHTDKVDESNRSKIRRSSRILKNNKIIIEHEKISKSNVLPKRSKSTREKTQSHHSKDEEDPTETYKAFPCKECDKSFQYASALKLHTVSHTSEKPYICDRCSSSFTQKSHLTRHLLIHKKNAKTFECSECKMSFRQRFYLQAHMRSHSGAKPYSCKECSKSFSQKSHLNTHAKSHQEKKIICDLCNKHFTLLHHLSSHMQNVHNF